MNGNSSRGSNKYNSHSRDDTGSPRPSKANEGSQVEGSKHVSHTLNTIAWRFARGGVTPPVEGMLVKLWI